MTDKLPNAVDSATVLLDSITVIAGPITISARLPATTADWQHLLVVLDLARQKLGIPLPGPPPNPPMVLTLHRVAGVGRFHCHVKDCTRDRSPSVGCAPPRGGYWAGEVAVSLPPGRPADRIAAVRAKIIDQIPAASGMISGLEIGSCVSLACRPPWEVQR